MLHMRKRYTTPKNYLAQVIEILAHFTCSCSLILHTFVCSDKYCKHAQYSACYNIDHLSAPVAVLSAPRKAMCAFYSLWQKSNNYKTTK